MAASPNQLGASLKSGTKLRAFFSQREYSIDHWVGVGGQGEVYKLAKIGETELALKWYSDRNALSPPDRKYVELIVRKEAPNRAFVWPVDLVELQASKSWGYLMPWIPTPPFYHPAQIVNQTVATSFRALFRAAFLLSTAMRDLHAKGYCYRDLNLGNAKIDPANGNVLVCDCDNVAFCGIDIAVFHPFFVAPECLPPLSIKPNWNTDLYGLAIFLFWILVHQHPLIGSVELQFNDAAQAVVFCMTNPLFIFHPDDHRNAPHPEVHNAALVYWRRIPEWVKSLFLQTFTEGLLDPPKRATEAEWQKATLRAHDAILICAKCGQENFYDWKIAVELAGQVPCTNCSTALRMPPRMRLAGQNDQMVLLGSDATLFLHHTGGPENHYDLSNPTGRVVLSSDGTRTGLLNLSAEKWVVTTEGSYPRDIPPRQTVELQNKMKIHFGKATGEIRV
jgi:eukaryotic-like serine/threonine-protein kinase